jgi:tetratricopeptide (TPR) repeat protein
VPPPSAPQDGPNRDLLGLSPGQILDGRFAIDSLIGAGGQGLVFKVKHLEWNRDFALKVPLPDSIRSENARNRFIKEAETWIRMGVHPNIVRCWFVRPVAGLPGLFLDLVAGGSLESKIESGAVAPGQWETILLVLIQISEGLTHSHSKGVVHRDLKPENLLVQKSGEICITDFGLVKTLSEKEVRGVLDGPLPETNTITDGQMGTPRYGAPEQWTNPETISPATDLYSFGAIMFEMICGQRPFDPPGRKADPLTLINRHILDEPPNPRSLQPEIPVPLVELCLQCLAKKPADRPQTAAEVLARLSQILGTHCHKSYIRPAPVPAGERPGLLNNAAASLFSLGRAKQARELLLKGLMIEAGHPQCLFNLVQMDRREGKIDRAESFRRLKRAKADFELALLYIEEGLGPKASEHLERIDEKEKSGFIYRTEGDALMYAERYVAAEAAYQKAQELMPNDLPSRFRGALAARRTTQHDGRLFFPSLQSCFRSRAHHPDVEILLSSNSQRIIGISETEVVILSTDANSILGSAKRPNPASQLQGAWSSGHRLLLQDRTGFEMWSLTNLALRQREEGLVLAHSDDLNKLVLLTSEGVVYVDRSRGVRASLSFPPGTQPSRHVLASFTPDESGLCVLTPDGRVATVQEQRIVPLPWPPPFANAKEICAIQLGDTTVTIARASGVVECFDFVEEKLLFSHDLGFRPESLKADVTGDILILSSRVAFTILNRKGQMMLRGRGPCALDSTRQYGLVWQLGFMTLFQLAPFHRIRSWTDKIPQPRSVRIADDGCRALSLDAQGTYQVWEVDEISRVYERNLLVTPGESYEQLIQSYNKYLGLYNRALKYHEDEQPYQSYLALQSARSVSGFQQAEEALDLQWALCSELRREGLEAIWERLYIPDAVSGHLSSDSRHLLIVQAFGVELFHLSGPNITKKLTLESPSELVGASFVIDKTDLATVVTLTKDGLLQYFEADGEQILSQQLGLGRLRSVNFGAGLALLYSEKGSLAALDLINAKIVATVDLGGRQFESAFHLSGGKAMIVTAREFLIMDLLRSDFKPGLPLTLERLPGTITFVSDHPESPLRMTGFSDGTLIISHVKDGRPLLGINQENGPVTGACLNLPTALGVSVSSSGGITLFGLDTGRVLERFVAHSDGIAEITMTEDGRYITTRSRGGQFRLWEISWTLSDKLGNRKIEWLPSTRRLSKLGKFFKR